MKSVVVLRHSYTFNCIHNIQYSPWKTILLVVCDPTEFSPFVIKLSSNLHRNPREIYRGYGCDDAIALGGLLALRLTNAPSIYRGAKFSAWRISIRKLCLPKQVINMHNCLLTPDKTLSIAPRTSLVYGARSGGQNCVAVSYFAHKCFILSVYYI